MAIQVERESVSTKSRFVSPTYTDNSGVQQVVGSDKPLPMKSIDELRLIEGKSFAIGAVRNFSNPLPANNSIDIALAFPAGVTPAINIFGICTGDAVGYLYEGASVTGGTSITPLNKNRDSAIASQGVALLNPTVTSLGTAILSQILIGGQGKKASGDSMHSSDLILKPLTTYLFRLTNVNGTAHAAEMILGWYE